MDVGLRVDSRLELTPISDAFSPNQLVLLVPKKSCRICVKLCDKGPPHPRENTMDSCHDTPATDLKRNPGILSILNQVIESLQNATPATMFCPPLHP